MDTSRDGIKSNTPCDNSSRGAMTIPSNCNQTVESLLGGSLGVLNRSGLPRGLNSNMVGNPILQFTNSQRLQHINTLFLPHSISTNLAELILGTSQHNPTPIFPSADLVRIASGLPTSAHHQSSSNIPELALAILSGKHGIGQQELVSILAGLQSKNGAAKTLDTNNIVALLGDLSTPTLDQLRARLSALSEYAPTNEERQIIGTCTVHDLDTGRTDLETASGKREGTAVGLPVDADGETFHSRTTRTATKSAMPPNSDPNSMEHELTDDQPYATTASTKSNAILPDNQNVEPTHPFLLPCRARGMPSDHNFRNAHFVIPGNVQHGEELICSYQACRNAGIKFQYCASCRIPVAKRNFNQRHSHGLDDSLVHASRASLQDTSNGGVVPVLVSSLVGDHHLTVSSHDSFSQEKKSPAPVEDDDGSTIALVRHHDKGDLNVGIVTQHRDSVDVMVTASPPSNGLHRRDDGGGDVMESLSTVVHTKREPQTTVTISTKNSDRNVKKQKRHLDIGQSHRPRLLEPIPDISIDRQLRWASLLRSRPNIDDSDLLSAWLMEVMAVSDLRRELPQTLLDVSNSASSSTERTSACEGLGDDLSDPSTKATTSSLTSSVRDQEDTGETHPNHVTEARESGTNNKRRLTTES